MSKRRTRVTLDDRTIAAAQRAMGEDDTDSVSAFVNDSIVPGIERDRRLAALAELVAEYESLHGEITDGELAEQAHLDRDATAAMRIPSGHRTG